MRHNFEVFFIEKIKFDQKKLYIISINLLFKK